jgi:DNA-binding MarR family transcriptional regulator
MKEDPLSIIAGIDRNIHSPARLSILACLAVVKTGDFTFLLHQTSLTRGNLSVNLGKLEEAGYVSIKKEFVDKMPRTLIRLTAKGRKAIRLYCEDMQQVIDGMGE